MTGFIQKHQGRVVGTAGDSVLADLASVVDAVRCAVEIQNELKTRNADLPENRRMEFRIGVNLGDVVEEGDTIVTKSKPTRPFRSGRGPRGSPGPRLSTPPFKGGASSGRTGEALEILQDAGKWEVFKEVANVWESRRANGVFIVWPRFQS